MNKEFIMIGAMILMSVLVISTANVGAQNATTNASNAARNLSASANQTASELGQNASLALNRTGETLGEVGENASVVGGDILNKTGEGVKGFLGGAADVVSNISEEVKEGISNNSNSSK
jgi:ABC-type tungstate transport system substrate-binding protein